MRNNIYFTTGNENLIDDIKDLWEELNRLHLGKSPYFQHYYKTFTFQARKEALISASEKGQLFIIIAHEKDVKIAYCVASFVDGIGEIDSIYVKPEYRSAHIGKALMETALEWIKSNRAKKITVKVAFGNEEVFGFYAKFGFAPRLTEMQIIEN